MELKILLKLSYLSSLLLLCNCASKGTVVIRSTPAEASVYLIDQKNGQSVVLGKTPLTFNKALSENKDADIFQLRFEKEGYESRFASVAAFTKETTYLDIKMSSTSTTNMELRKSFEVNRQLLAEATRLAAGKRFSEALTRIEKILETDPKNDQALAAKGSLLYLMKDYDGAQAAWQKSLATNPSNDQVRTSLIDLNLSVFSEKRSPANTEGQ